MQSLQSERPRKIRRTGRACDYCHRRSIRCQPSQDRSQQCQNCFDFSQACTYDRPAKKRGARSRPTSAVVNGNDSSNTGGLESRSNQNGDDYGHVAQARLPSRQLSHEHFMAPIIASQGTVMDLVEVYFEVTYPM